MNENSLLLNLVLRLNFALCVPHHRKQKQYFYHDYCNATFHKQFLEIRIKQSVCINNVFNLLQMITVVTQTN